MRIIIAVIIIFSISKAYAQKCEPSTSVRTVMCPNNDSVSICFKCEDCIKAIVSSDSLYTVISYKMILRTIKEGKLIEKEVENYGNSFGGPAKRLIEEARSGDTIFFTCVKARNKTKIFILQPVSFELR